MILGAILGQPFLETARNHIFTNSSYRHSSQTLDNGGCLKNVGFCGRQIKKSAVCDFFEKLTHGPSSSTRGHEYSA